jgi:hypothetical protein
VSIIEDPAPQYALAVTGLAATVACRSRVLCSAGCGDAAATLLWSHPCKRTVRVALTILIDAQGAA